MKLLKTDTWHAELREERGLLSRTAAGNQASVELRAHKWKRSLFSPLCFDHREGVFPYNDKNLSSETGSRTTEHKVYFRNKRYEYSSQRSYLYHLNYILNWHMAEHVALPLCYIIVPVENKVVIPDKQHVKVFHLPFTRFAEMCSCIAARLNKRPLFIRLCFCWRWITQ